MTIVRNQLKVAITSDPTMYDFIVLIPPGMSQRANDHRKEKETHALESMEKIKGGELGAEQQELDSSLGRTGIPHKGRQRGQRQRRQLQSDVYGDQVRSRRK